MVEPPSNKTRSPQFWWVYLCRWLWTGLQWVWGAIILVVGINIGSSWLISTTLNIAHTPVGWLLAHSLITIPVSVGLLILTAITGIVTAVHHRPPEHYSSPTLEQQNRQRFIAKLKNRYEDILEQSLQGAVQIVLGFRLLPDAVVNSTRLRLYQAAQQEQELPAGMSILQIYDRASGELLILGEPGAGKSIQLFNLATALLDRASGDERHPLPVIVNLSTWANTQQPLQEWLVREVAISYGVPRLAVAKWIEIEGLLPLLDGLDEVPSAQRSACIEAINAFHRDHLVPVVVCSRSEEYAGQEERLALESAVVVQSLDAVQVGRYFKEMGPPLAGVHSMLRKNEELRKLVKTPLMLHVLTLAYRGVPMRALPRKGSKEDQQRQVFDEYVQCMLSQQNLLSPISAEQMKRDLVWLARQMQQHNQTIFYLELLQPDWLSASLPLQTYEVLAIRIPGILIGVLISLLVTKVLFSFHIPEGIWHGLVGGLVGGLVSGSKPSSFQFSGIKRAWKNRWRQYFPVGLGIGVFFGGLIGVAFALWGDPNYWENSFQGGLIFGIGAGLGALLLYILISAGKIPILQTKPVLSRGSRWRHRYFNADFVRLGVLVGLLEGLSVGLSVGLDTGLHMGLAFGLIYGIGVGLIFVPVFGFIGISLGFLLLRRNNTIEPAERVVWSVRSLGRSLVQKHHLRNALRLFLAGLIIGLIAGLGNGLVTGLANALNTGLSYGLSYGLNTGLNTGLDTGLSYGLSAGLVYWVMLGLWNGVSRGTLTHQQRVVPNEGIRLSARNGLLMGLIAGGLCGLIGFLNATLYIGPRLEMSFGLTFVPSAGLRDGVIIGMAGGLLAGLLTGGWACIQHIVLRVLLRRDGLLPLHSVQFLDDATRRILLLKDGGGYRFIHPLFQEYFAAQGIGASPSSLVQPSPQQP